jgi:hypothetical protein
LGEVKAAVRSAEIKLEQVAAIAAAGRMCEYRGRAIAAHARGGACEQEARLARAHIEACSTCKRTYVRMVREMRGQDFRRGASAAFLPAPLLPAVAHTGLVARLSAFLYGHRLPSWGGSGERAAGLLGGGGVVKAAAAGTALVIAGAGFGGRVLHSLDHSTPAHVRHQVAAHRAVDARVATPLPLLTTRSYISVGPTARPATHIRQDTAARVGRLPSRGLGYLAVGGEAGDHSSGNGGAPAANGSPSATASVASSTSGRAASGEAMGSEPSQEASSSDVPPRPVRSGGGASLSYLGG